MSFLLIDVAEDVLKTYKEMKIRSKYSHLIFKMEGDNKLVIESEGAKEETYADFVGKLPPNECRFAVVDFPFNLPDGRKQSKLVFFLWSPDNGATGISHIYLFYYIIYLLLILLKCSVKDKMLYSSAKAAIKERLSGTAREVQANDLEGLEEQAILKLVY
eukprot:GHVR01178234.1.p1 GENE.GHVR01178234.1~~GHVR01178234.1.p1  ORF type:complete len:172 (+),score=35.77 GHVR01178234.1:37-516(+)